MSLREAIWLILEKYDTPQNKWSINVTLEIFELFEKRIDKVEQDYKSALSPYLQKQPMKDVYPKEMDALERIRNELV